MSDATAKARKIIGDHVRWHTQVLGKPDFLTAMEIISAISEAGLLIVDPTDCDRVTVPNWNPARGTGPADGWFPAGSYLLVPLPEGDDYD